MNASETKVEMKASVEDGFRKWMEKPATKLMVSLIPPSENPDAMDTLLRSCYADAHGAGEGAVAIMMIEAMFKPRPNDREQDRRESLRREDPYRNPTRFDPYDRS